MAQQTESGPKEVYSSGPSFGANQRSDYVPSDEVCIIGRSHSVWGLVPSMVSVFCVALASTAAQARDGAHDFDFSIGLWHVAIHRTPDPFAAPGETYEMSGSINVQTIWGGKAHIEEMEVDGPKGHWEGLNLFCITHRLSGGARHTRLVERGKPNHRNRKLRKGRRRIIRAGLPRRSCHPNQSSLFQCDKRLVSLR
jgi:hypothetical protein